jgi:hypothetical protein
MKHATFLPCVGVVDRKSLTSRKTGQAIIGCPKPTHGKLCLACGSMQACIDIHLDSFNQLDLPEYESYEQLKDSIKLAITEASEGFGFG